MVQKLTKEQKLLMLVQHTKQLNNIHKILLTGGNGFIGSCLHSQFKGQASVTIIDYENDSTEKDFISLE